MVIMKKNTQFSTSIRQKIRNKLSTHSKLYSISKSIHKTYCQSTHFFHSTPDYLILGASKSGTSSLYEYLIQHPKVKPAITKQIHYFDKYFERGISWYKICFPLNLKKIFFKKFITGEATPYYLCHPLAPSRISKLFPHVKLIILLRNPIDRAFSHYQMEFTRYKEDLSFEDAIEIENNRIKVEIQKIIKNPNYVSDYLPNHAYITSSIYFDRIKLWLDYFPKDQFLFIKSEDLFEDPERIYSETLDFLEIENYKLEKYEIVRKGEYVSKINSQTRKKLNEFFKPYNKKLSNLLKRNFEWD